MMATLETKNVKSVAWITSWSGAGMNANGIIGKRHLTLNGTETLCGREIPQREIVAKPDTQELCQRCGKGNTRLFGPT